MPATIDAEPRLFVEAGDFDRAVLEELEEPYELREISLDEIDVDKSQRVLNQVRLGPAAYSQEHADTLRTALEQGSELPPGIVHRDDEGRNVILSGNHRFPAHRAAGRQTMPFYVATELGGLPTSDPRVQDVALRANVAHGEPVETEHRLQHAAQLVESGHYTVKGAAEAMVVPEAKLRDQVEKLKARRRLAELGISVDQIPISVARRLHSISSDGIVKAAAKLVPKMTQKAEETNELVVALNQARSEKEQLAIVREKSDALDAAGTVQAQARNRKTGSFVNPKVRRLDGALAVVIRFDLTQAGADAMPSEFREKLKTRVREANRALLELEKMLR
jgi:hypothetical protein